MAASPLMADRAPARPATLDRANQHRRSMIAKIQIAKKQLNIFDADYRQALFDRTGKLKTNECSDAQLVVMLDFLKSKGFRPIPKKGVAQHPMARKARALWMSLYHLGVVHNASEQALEAFAKRQLKCEKLVWARQSDAFKLIEALKDWAERSGWSQVGATSVRELKERLCEAILQRLKKAGAVPADWLLHTAAHRLCGIVKDHAWSVEDFDEVATALGAKLREFGGSAAA